MVETGRLQENPRSHRRIVLGSRCCARLCSSAARRLAAPLIWRVDRVRVAVDCAEEPSQISLCEGVRRQEGGRRPQFARVLLEPAARNAKGTGAVLSPVLSRCRTRTSQ